MVITDHFDHVIDDKNRLAIPSQIRNALDPKGEGLAFYLVPMIRHMQLIPEPLFVRLANVLPAGLIPTPNIAKARRLVLSNTSRLELDSQGRVIIPDRFLLEGKSRDSFTTPFLERKVTLVGAVDRLELWNRADYAANMRHLEDDRGTFQAEIDLLYGHAPATSGAAALTIPGTQAGT